MTGARLSRRIMQMPTAATCCIAGGGPAGMMLGYLLARAGIEALVLEKHADFLRDFRGDTVHPSTLEVMHELGLLDDFLKRPHQMQVRQVRARIGCDEVVLGDMSSLSTRCRFMVMMPQWEFLDFLAEQARRYPTFHLRMQTEVTGLIEENGRIAGIRGNTPAGPLEVRTDLVVGADGRNSVVRDCSGLAVEDVGAPTDVLWMRLSKHADDPDLLGYADRGKALFMTDRGDYWQCGFPAPKEAVAQMQTKGIEDFRAGIVELAPFLRDRVTELRDWSDVKLLTVRVDRLLQWHRPGLVCIGDAAHAMSPVGGVGINLAIQDAVAAANILVGPLRQGAISVKDLAKIQRRRAFPTRLTQRVQAQIQKRLMGRGLLNTGPTRLPWSLRLLERTTLPRRLRTRFISVGIRPEHVKTPDVSNARSGLVTRNRKM
jgi:2-polyprenyl-6-methoxyphenol hydroxylase-like FAD-dependent oxidoreductase